MVRGFSWQADGSSANQKIVRVLWKSGLNYRIHKNLLFVPILSQINPIHAPHPFHSLKVYFIIISPSMSNVSGLLQSLPPQKSLCTFPLSYTCSKLRSFHSSGFVHPLNIWWVHFIKLHVISSLPPCCNIVPPMTKYLSITLFFNILSLRFSLRVIESVTLFLYQ